MYGVMFGFLKEYVVKNHGGNETWRSLLTEAGQSAYKIYFATKDYPDEEIVAIATAASEALSLPISDVLEDFGSYVGPRLIEFYHPYIDGHDQDTFSVVPYAGGSIHDQIHKHNPDRKPPQLSAEILDEERTAMEVHYKSHRMMCSVVRGVLRGLGEHFSENLHINETQCMHSGAEKCIIMVTKTN
jgi:predicted hydrocarbon binding protein